MNRPEHLGALLARLDGVTQHGEQFQARCPCASNHNHGDKTPSLSVSLGRDGRILLFCQSQKCPPEEIVAAIDMSMADLFPGQTTDKGTAALGDPVKTYDYRDAQGEPLFQVVRYKGKQFRQRRPDGNGGWLWDLRGVPRVLYRLPSLLKAPKTAPIFVVEGEKDADNLEALGLTATTCSGGAGKWHLVDDSALHGHRVVILGDNDGAGRKHIEQVARRLHGKAADVRILELPNLPEGGDVSDWLAEVGECVDAADALTELAGKAPLWQPRAGASDSTEDKTPIVVVRRLADVPPTKIEWLYPGKFPLGMVAIITADPGSGKSTLLADIASRVSRGTPWPDLQGQLNPAGDVILLIAEDGIADTVRVRVDAAGGDPERVFILEGVRHPESDYTAPFCLDRDMRHLEDLLAKTPGVRLIGIDPLDCFLGDSVDSHRKSEVQAALSRLSDLAERHRVAVIGVLHLRKQSGDKAMYRTLGSLGFVSAPRAVWLLSRDPKDRAKRLMTCVKMNIAPDPTGLAFRIENAGDCGVIHWLADPVNMTADEALEAENPKSRTARDEAADWLLEFLALGPVHSDRIKEAAAAAGIAERTLWRAKKALGIDAVQRDDGWYWQPPGGGPGAE